MLTFEEDFFSVDWSLLMLYVRNMQLI